MSAGLPDYDLNFATANELRKQARKPLITYSPGSAATR